MTAAQEFDGYDAEEFADFELDAQGGFLREVLQDEVDAAEAREAERAEANQGSEPVRDRKWQDAGWVPVMGVEFGNMVRAATENDREGLVVTLRRMAELAEHWAAQATENN